MKKSFSTLCCMNYGLDEIIALAKDGGVPAVELRLDNTRLDQIFDSAEDWKSAFSNNGVELVDIAAGICVRECELSEYDYKYVRFAKAVGAKAVRIFGGINIGDSVCEMCSGVQKLCDFAKDCGVEIWLETHSEFSTGKMCRQVLDRVKADNLKIIWDVMHSLEYGEALEDSIKYLGDKIVHLHLKDGKPSENGQGEYIHTDLGEGHFPFKKLLTLMQDAGYNGYYSLEWESFWREEIRDLYPDVTVLLRKYSELLDELKKEINR